MSVIDCNSFKSLGLTITLNPASGFCTGVVRAIRMAEEKLNRGEIVYCVGNIVHNEEERLRLERKGLKTVGHGEMQSLEGANVLFRAHGEPPSSYDNAESAGIILSDATCPVVLKLQERIRRACDAGERVFLFGKPDHPEVVALAGQRPGSVTVIGNLSDIDHLTLPASLTLFSQTTRSRDQLHDLARRLRERGVEVTLHDTVCRQVSDREASLAAFAAAQDVNLFVSGKDSSNGRVLFDICRNASANSHFISSTEEIDPAWFLHGQQVGVSGATSTPLWLLEKVKERLEGKPA